MTFLILMGILATVLIIAMAVGEERFNKWFACKHDWECLDENGEKFKFIDENGNNNTEEPAKTICSRCGRDSKKENKE